ncbi:MAG: HAD-IIB family hydrolase [Ruminococcus sp.]|nr:HAD-IIB family hydrolase [Ruminococcus sp.]
MGRYTNFLLLTDLDGTLLPQNKLLSSVDLTAIRQFRSEGGKFSIATGRTLQAAQRYLDALELDIPVILFNGAAIYDPAMKSMLNTVTLPSAAVEVTRLVLDTFPDVSAEILCVDNTYVPRMTFYEQEHLRICQVEPVCEAFDELPHGSWLKVLFAMAPERMADVASFFHEKQIDFADFVQSEAHFYEMLPKSTTKGSALQKLRRMPLFQNMQVVAVGDFDNDLEMLQTADISVCSSNAQPCVQAMADLRLTASCDTGAIAELIDKL